ncbi:zf-TFIIB domain-containing protein [Maritimibacter dapengensis]|uniref:Zf-TFIIB domain-containing protein n=1 Tax=Maritimibacter dapengensis TaxID=2836868 RepID=A0ABS6SZ24_9RHOB|nr:zf-TFIIB domain-containing protein [Maritimibacter dapengensis]MBV7378134.1 zf-TFIIB domain-containing protein [Maritimibacter dapengensis]
MICPNCAREMEHLSQHGVSVDRCYVCGGVWLDKGELETIVETVRAPVVLGQPERPNPPVRTAKPDPRSQPEPTPRRERQPDRRGGWDDDWREERTSSRKFGRKYSKKYSRSKSTKARLKYILKEILD